MPKSNCIALIVHEITRPARARQGRDKNARMNDAYGRFRDLLYYNAELELSLDISRIRAAKGFFEQMEPRMQQAYEAMAALESGAVANPDEGRRVGYYWLRAPELAPETAMTEAIEGAIDRSLAF